MKSFIEIFIIFIILPFDVNNQSTSRKPNGPNMYSVKADRFICYSSDFCLNPICKIKHIARDKQLIYGSCNVTKIVSSAKIHFRFYYKYHLTYQPFPIDIREDLCGFLDNKKSLPIIKHLYAATKEYLIPNPFKCPMFGNVTLNNAPFNLGFFPQMLPAGQYRVDGRAYSKQNETVLNAHLYVVVDGQNAINYG